MGIELINVKYGRHRVAHNLNPTPTNIVYSQTPYNLRKVSICTLIPKVKVQTKH
jgi:hypothetical protein